MISDGRAAAPRARVRPVSRRTAVFSYLDARCTVSYDSAALCDRVATRLRPFGKSGVLRSPGPDHPVLIDLHLGPALRERDAVRRVKAVLASRLGPRRLLLRACGVVVGDGAVLFLGRGGSGKGAMLLEVLTGFKAEMLSAGLAVLAWGRGGLRARGWPSALSLAVGTLHDHPALHRFLGAEDRRRLYAEACSVGSRRRFDAVEVAAALDRTIVPEAPVRSLVFLRCDSAAPPRLAPIESPREVREWLTRVVAAPGEGTGQRVGRAARALRAAGVPLLEMTWGPDPGALLRGIASFEPYSLARPAAEPGSDPNAGYSPPPRRARGAFAAQTRAVFDHIHRAQDNDEDLYRRLVSLVSSEYFGLGDEFPRGLRVLDAGCGSNANASVAFLELGAAEVVSFDLGKGWMETARRRLAGFGRRSVCRSGSVLKLPRDLGRFDFVHCAGVLHHTVDPELGFRNLARVTIAGGHTFVTLMGTGDGLLAQCTNLLRRRYRSEPRFREQVDGLTYPELRDLIDWLLTRREEEEGGIGAEREFVHSLFDADLLLTLRDRLQAPTYHGFQFSEAQVRRWFESASYEEIRRITRYPRGFRNLRRFLSPLYQEYRHPAARALFGEGYIQMIGRRSAAR
jgi:SAM-dependent methyltransferase